MAESKGGPLGRLEGAWNPMNSGHCGGWRHVVWGAEEGWAGGTLG